MTELSFNGAKHYYELCGEGTPLVFIHGAFADARMWDSQWQYFSANYSLLRYDLRGHGRTGASTMDRYSMETFADDLGGLLDALDVKVPVLCGQSFGGSIAQTYAVRNPDKIRALILAGSMVAIDLSPMDKILCRVFFPGWAMTAAIKAMSVEKFMHFSLWLGRVTKGKQFLSQEESVARYLEYCMLQIISSEYLKIWRALYGFRLSPLERITCPTLVLNGAHEPKGLLLHTREVLRRVPHAEATIIPDANHASNMDNPRAFNRLVEDFLHRALG